ncbi:hypothetical protein DIPPA_12673 [Diplonema papillatum]|nr:hypothetical protein DIPPA_12673 [Diplonema papillatum]
MAASNAVGWAAVALFCVSARLSVAQAWRPPYRRPNLFYITMLLLADSTNLTGSILAQAPSWQLVVAIVFLVQDSCMLFAFCTMLYAVAETASDGLKRSFLLAAGVTTVFSSNALIRKSPDIRLVAIQMGVISALCNITSRVCRTPLSSPSESTLHYWFTILGQFCYSTAILTHPDNVKGQPFIEEAAPWLLGSLVPALLEYNSATEQQQRQNKLKESFV